MAKKGPARTQLKKGKGTGVIRSRQKEDIIVSIIGARNHRAGIKIDMFKPDLSGAATRGRAILDKAGNPVVFNQYSVNFQANVLEGVVGRILGKKPGEARKANSFDKRLAVVKDHLKDKGFKAFLNILQNQKGVNAGAVRRSAKDVVGVAFSNMEFLPPGFSKLEFEGTDEAVVGMRSLHQFGSRAVIDRGSNQLLGVLHHTGKIPVHFLDMAAGRIMPLVKSTTILRDDEILEVNNDKSRLRRKVSIVLPSKW